VEKQSRVAIVGFPNVGKSTLFNRLLGKKKALVHSLSGMTRDQIPALCRLDDRAFLLVDTGGFFDSQEDPFSPLVKKKAWSASRDADILLFVCDGKRGLLPGEEELYFSLKKLNKPLLVVVNKVDSSAEEARIGDFYRLGEIEILAVSAEHKRNLDILEERLLALLPHTEPEEEASKALRIALVGRINVGKSSLVNRLCGEDRLIVSQLPGTTRDSTDTLIRRNRKAYILVDTAGIRRLSRTSDKREKAGIVKARKDIRRADVICLILDATEFATRRDIAVARLAGDSWKPLLIALNKWDLITKELRSPEAFRARIVAKMDFVSYAPLVFVSALTGQRVVKILELAEEVYANASKEIPTPRLNRFLARMNEMHPPLSRQKRRIKIRYMVQKSARPPSFILFTSTSASLDPSYETFFLRSLRREFRLWGTPIRLSLRKS